MRFHTVKSKDGLSLKVRDAGPEDAPAILLVHGWSQSSLSWKKQLQGDLTKHFRIVAPDLRGHGDSDKPDDEKTCRTDEAWAGDIAAVIETLSLKKPLLVGWSMGGKVVGDYLGAYGDANVSGVVLVAAPIYVTPEDAAARSDAAKAVGSYSEDAAVAIPAITAFLRACYAQQPSEEDFAEALAFNMQCPPKVRQWSRNRVPDYRPVFQGLSVPLAYFYGAEEQIVAPKVCKALIADIPGCRAVEFPGCGHSPFFEDPQKFDAELAAFATETMGVAA